ncbi:MAG: integrin alpha, partial [Chloroflexi bacterium]|nr:integrin alpha [Chloroflexota bacterium]
GYDDLLISAYLADGPGNTRPNAGESYLVFGGSALPATIDLASLGSAGVILFGVNPGDGSGRSVSTAGDVNGDGYDELIIGAHRGDGPFNSRYNAGESYLVFGGSALPATIDLAALGPAGVTLFGVNNVDYSGYSVSGAEDANGDGYDDLLIGAPLADGPANSRPGAGESYLVFGSSALPATIDLGALGPTGAILYGTNNDDHSGLSVSGAGDANGDGYTDLLIGAPYADGPANGRDFAGESYLVFGSSALPATVDLGMLDTAGVILYGANNVDASGQSVSGAGDVNGDGYADLLIGAPLADGPADSRPDAGESYLVLGRPDTLPATPTPTASYTPSATATTTPTSSATTPPTSTTTPTPSATVTPSPTPTNTATPVHQLYLPVVRQADP